MLCNSYRLTRSRAVLFYRHMKKFKKFLVDFARDFGGTRHRYRFPNGYEASVVRHRYSYGGREGLFELAVITARGLQEPQGYLTEKKVCAILGRLQRKKNI